METTLNYKILILINISYEKNIKTYETTYFSPYTKNIHTHCFSDESFSL